MRINGTIATPQRMMRDSNTTDVGLNFRRTFFKQPSFAWWVTQAGQTEWLKLFWATFNAYRKILVIFEETA
jgi:hypothetical protein